MKLPKNRDNSQKKLQLLILIALFPLYACKDKTRRDIALVVNEWIGKEIKFPENMPCFVSGKETLSEFCDENFHRHNRFY